MVASDIALMLRLEHRNFSTLLDLLDLEVERMDREGALDYELVRALLDYFLHYADQCHHPKEDLVYRKLSASPSFPSEGLSDLLEEHKELDKLTGRLVELLGTAHAASDIPNREVEAGLRRFLSFYRHHMAMEEEYFLVAAERLLSKDDWDEIEFDLFDKKDPVFDEEVEQRYKMLRDRITAM